MPVEILWNCSGNVWGNLSGNNVQRRVDLDLVLEKCWTLEKKLGKHSYRYDSLLKSTSPHSPFFLWGVGMDNE